MSATAFRFTSPLPITSQPAGAGEKIIIRSEQTADAGNLTFTGLVAAVSTAEVLALLGKREVESTNTFTTFSSGKLSAAQTGAIRVYGQGTKALGDLRIDTNPANNDTIKIGLTGFEITYTFKTTLTGAANEIFIGATAADTATNLKKAINDEGTEATHYGTGTAPNPFVSATVVTTVISLTDRIAIARQLAWSISQTVGATIAVRTMIGGVTGTLLATITAGLTHTYNSFTLSSESLVTDTLPALFTGTSDAINVGGRQCTLRFKCENVGSAIVVNYQTSTDGTNWATGLFGSINVDNNSVAVPSIIPLTDAASGFEQNIEYIRLNVATNANTTDSAVDARVIAG